MSKKKFDTVEEAVAHYEALAVEAEKAHKKLGESAEKAAREMAALVEKLKAAESRITELEEDLEAEKETSAEALEQMAEMGKKLNVLEKHKGSDCEIVTIAGQEYKLIGKKFRTRKGRLTAEELAKDPELLEEMLEKKSGSLVLAD